MFVDLCYESRRRREQYDRWQNLLVPCWWGRGQTSPEEIEKLPCKVASSEMVEKEVTEEVCKLIKEHFPAKMPPNCESVVGAL